MCKNGNHKINGFIYSDVSDYYIKILFMRFCDIERKY